MCWVGFYFSLVPTFLCGRVPMWELECPTLVSRNDMFQPLGTIPPKHLCVGPEVLKLFPKILMCMGRSAEAVPHWRPFRHRSANKCISNYNFVNQAMSKNTGEINQGACVMMSPFHKQHHQMFLASRCCLKATPKDLGLTRIVEYIFKFSFKVAMH